MLAQGWWVNTNSQWLLFKTVCSYLTPVLWVIVAHSFHVSKIWRWIVSWWKLSRKLAEKGVEGKVFTVFPLLEKILYISIVQYFASGSSLGCCLSCLKPFVAWDMATWELSGTYFIDQPHSIREGMLQTPLAKEFQLVWSRKRTFSAISPALWNFLPPEMRQALSSWPSGTVSRPGFANLHGEVRLACNFGDGWCLEGTPSASLKL